MPELNTQLFQKIHDQITAHPSTHEQADFEDGYDSGCGVTRCVAGWAILIDAYDKGETITSFRRSSAFVASDESPSMFARQLLGLTFDEGDHLFFQTTNEEAVEFVKSCAEGVRPAAPFEEG